MKPLQISSATIMAFCALSYGSLTPVTANAAPKLEGSVEALPRSVDLTSQGPADWAHWGFEDTPDFGFNHKAGVLQQISDFTHLGEKLRRFQDARASYSWDDGTPQSAASGVTQGVFSVISGDDETGGFEFTVNASTSERLLKVYLGGFRATGHLSATLSDGSAAAFTADFQGASVFDQVVALRFEAASDDQSLTIRYDFDDTDVPLPNPGNISLTAATLERSVAMDIRPFSRVNFVFPRFRGAMPVAILTTSVAAGDDFDFDAAQVDIDTIAFGPNGATPLWGRSWSYDVDGDGDADRVFALGTKSSGIACGDNDATLTGLTFSGDSFFGTDDIRTFGCHRHRRRR